VGCATDRECVRVTDDATARCVLQETPPVCKVPCTTHFDCTAGGAHNYNGQTCSGGFCEPVGCENDAECHAQFGQSTYGVACRAE
jgi:hypothetical protein